MANGQVTNGNGNGNGASGLARYDAQPATALAATMDPRAAIAPRGPGDVWRLAESVAKAGLYGVRTTEEAMVRMATGMELGLSPMQSIRGVYVIEAAGMARPTLSADMMVGVCKQRRDVCRYFRLVETNDRQATYETHRVDEPEPVRMTYTIEQANRAGLAGKGTWKAHPEAMLRARAASSLARAVYPDVLNGLYDPSEFDEAPRQSAVAHVVESRVVDTVAGAVSDQVSTLHEQLLTCTTEGAFKQLAAKAKGLADRGAISADDFASFKVAYNEHKARVLAPQMPAAPAEQPHTREPGEEG